MKKIFTITLIVLAIAAMAIHPKHTITPPQGIAVLELYTSEGCSSCPPADEAVADIIKEYPDNVFVLGFHVDYWDKLGWKDMFSNEAYSNRQRKYGDALELSSIYTPQVIVNGKTEFVGSDKDAMHKAVESGLYDKPGTDFTLSATIKKDKNMVEVSYSVPHPEHLMINIALVQLQAITEVKRGENEGRKLKHVNVVRGFKTAPAKDGVTYLSMPASLSAAGCKVIAFIQKEPGAPVTGAAAAAIN